MPGARVGARATGGPIGILACGGALPLDIAEAVDASGRGLHIVAIDGSTDVGVARWPHERTGLGEIGRILSSFRRAGCREIVIAGAIERPDLWRLKVDMGFFRHLPTVLALTRGGDDSVLRGIVRFFEGQGFVIKGVGEVAPGLLAVPGVLGARTPEAEHQRAIARGRRLVAALGAFDVGQAVVATAERIVAVEGVRGTDAMLEDLAGQGPGAGLARGGVLVKRPKPGQEMRIDLPTIGPTTVARAAAAGLGGIAVEAGATIVLERARLGAAADAAGLFVAGFAADGACPAETFPGDTTPPATGRGPAVLGRRAPTPSERRDIGIARRLMPVLADAAAGRAAVIAGEHVLAVAGALPLEGVIAPLGGRRHWGLRALRERIGTLVLDLGPRVANGDDAPPEIGIELIRAARDARLAGIVCLGAPLTEAARADAIAWADEAKLFLMAEAG